MGYLRVADEARDRRKASKVPAAAGGHTPGIANLGSQMDDRIGAISSLLNDIATG